MLEDPDNPNTRDFRVASVDLNRDGVYEVVLEDRRQYWCGQGGCTNHIFQKTDGQWDQIGWFFPGGNFEISDEIRNGYAVIYYFAYRSSEEGWEKIVYECSVQENETWYTGDCI